MTPVAKAIWYIETHIGREPSLDDIAATSGVSRFHLSRAFSLTTGLPVITYLRARRLTEAAKALAAGAPDILSVALDAGYSSHEAFTRAFRDQFGLTPEQTRAKADLTALPLQEAIRMSQAPANSIQPTRFEDRAAFCVAGVSARYTGGPAAGIPAQWQKLVPHLGALPGQVSDITYGVMCNFDDAGGFDYIAAVEVRDFNDLPADFARQRIPPQAYVIFTHKGHVTGISATIAAAWTDWLPSSGREAADGPGFERYDERFNPMTGQGEVEVWMPLKPA